MRLELDQVGASYGDVTALRDVSLIVPAGGVVALLGPNGAGKSTLLSLASGLLRPRSGRVLVDGVDVSADRPDARARRGIVHVTEGRAIFPSLTVADNLRLFGRGGRQATALERAIDAFPRLGERLHQVAGTMSGGEQQMLALARAYAADAKVVLLDEVSMGLAPMVVDEIFRFLARVAAEGTSLLVVEQYVAKALALADTVYLLNRGRIVLAGETQQLAETDIFASYLTSD